MDDGIDNNRRSGPISMTAEQLKKEIENTLLKMNISIKDYANNRKQIKEDMELALSKLEDIDKIDKSIIEEERLHNEWYKKVNHDLIIQNESIDTSIYITSLKYDKKIKKLMKKIKNISIVKKKREKNKYYENLIVEFKDETASIYKKQIHSNFLSYISNNYKKHIITQLIYLFSIITFFVWFK